jgi:hypothetical protein
LRGISRRSRNVRLSTGGPGADAAGRERAGAPRELELAGPPVRIECRSGENPFAEKRNKLTARQVQRKRRLMSHVKKAKKSKKK